MLRILLSFVVAAALFMSCGEETEDVLAVSGFDAQSSLLAGDGQHPRLQALVEVLELDSQQQIQIFAALKSQFQEQKGSRKGRKRFNRKNISERRKELAAIVRPFLNAEQEKIFDEMDAEAETGQIPTRLLDHRVTRMQTELDLSEEQVVQIKSLLQERHQNRPQLATGDRPSRDALQAGHKYHRETREQLVQLLTSDQEALLTQKGIQRRQQHQQRRINRLSEHLSLSAEQETAVTALFAELRSDKGEKQRIRDMDENERREIFRQRREEMREKLNEILTAEQMEKWDSHRPRRHTKQQENQSSPQ